MWKNVPASIYVEKKQNHFETNQKFIMSNKKNRAILYKEKSEDNTSHAQQPLTDF